MYRLLVVCAGALFLAGCSGPQLRPPSGEVISIEAVNMASTQRVVSIHLDDYDCYGFNTAPYVSSSATGKTAVVEKKPFQSIMYQYLGVENSPQGLMSTNCMGAYTFSTGDDTSFRVITGKSKTSCSILVEASGPRNPLWHAVALTPRQISQPLMDSSGPWCAADARFRGSSLLAAPRGY